MSDFHFADDNDMWVYPPLNDDYEMAEWLEAVRIEDQLFVDADDAITQVHALQAENAKLRELVRDVVEGLSLGDIRDWSYGHRLRILDEARELGIEVDG